MESEKKRERSDEAEAEAEAEREQAWGLVRCSTEKEERKKSKFRLFKPLINTVTKRTTTTTSITIITPPENPNRHINLYLCIRTDIDAFSWIKLDPSNTTTTPTVAKSKSSSNSCSFNSKGNKENKKKNHRQQQRILLTPISDMPPTTPRSFRAIPHSPSENQKLVYAFGGQVVINGERSFSSKAFVCDFASTTNPIPVWEELPSMPSQLDICMGVASPLDGNVYAFGVMHNKRLSGPYNYAGLVFDPSSRTWNQCSHPFYGDFGLVKDYALVHTENDDPSSSSSSSTSNSQLVAFTYHEGHTFNLANTLWENSFSAPVPLPVRTSPDWNSDPNSTCVAVGHLVYKYIDRKLFALDTSSPKPSFEPVHGLDDKLPTYSETYGNAYIVYLGKGKLCIVWGHFPDPSENLPIGTLSIACLKFWVGMCSRWNRLQAVIDRCERFVAHGIRLHDVIAF